MVRPTCRFVTAEVELNPAALSEILMLDDLAKTIGHAGNVSCFEGKFVQNPSLCSVNSFGLSHFVIQFLTLLSHFVRLVNLLSSLVTPCNLPSLVRILSSCNTLPCLCMYKSQRRKD